MNNSDKNTKNIILERRGDILMQIKKDRTVDNKSKLIYTGLYQNPIDRTHHSNTLMFKDFHSTNLFAIIQSPSCFMDIYKEASAVKYLNIHIFTTSLSILYISDIARLIAELSKLNKQVFFYYPESIPEYFKNITVLENAYKHADNLSFNPSRGDQIIVRYIQTPMEGIYNIKINDGKHNIVICGYIDKETVEEIAKDDSVDKIHVPYLTNEFGGLSFKELMVNTDRRTIHSKVIQKLMINGFHNKYEYDEAVCLYPNRIVEVIHSL